MALHAIITAGGHLPRQLRPLGPHNVKALLSVGGRTLLAAAAQAARESGVVERSVAVGGGEVQRAAQELGIEYAAEGSCVVDNIYNGFLALGGEQHDYLIVSPDLPFIDGAALARFAFTARACCELGFAIVSREDFLARFPAAPNFFERLDGGRVTMGSVIFMTGRALKTNIPLGRDFYRNRKFPLRMAAMLGLSITVSFALGRLSLKQLEDRMERLTGVGVRGVLGCSPELAYDVDNRSNYDFAARLLEQ